MTTKPVTSATVPLRGPFDLAEIALMGFGHRDERTFDGVMRLAFCADDDYRAQVGVEVRQDGSELRLAITGTGSVDRDRVVAQVARVVSADHDGEAYAALCRADPALAPVWRVAPGFRPALFYSPYEAAVWSILSARRARTQGIHLRERLAGAHGAAFELAGQSVAAVPTPQQLLRIDSLPGLPADRIPRLHAVAEAAAGGRLSVSRLQALTPEEAMAEVQSLPGIGPFYSSLIVVRGLGLADVLSDEPHVHEAAEQRYGRSLDAAAYAELAESWRPFRTWVAVMLRALGSRVPDPAP